MALLRLVLEKRSESLRSSNPFAVEKRIAAVALSDSNTMDRHFSEEPLFSEKRRNSTSSLSDSTNSNPFLHKSSTVSLTEKDTSVKSSVPVLRLPSSKSSGTLLFNPGRRLLSRRKSSGTDTALDKSDILAVDNNLKTGVTFFFDNSISMSIINTMLMAIRRCQIGYHCMSFPANVISRGNVTPPLMCQFIEGVLDVYHTYITTPFNLLRDENFFYLKGYCFNVMFTHDKGGRCICLGSFPSDLLNQLKQDDVLYTRMKDEDDDDLAEEDLLSYRSSSRLLPSTNSVSQSEFVNSSVIIQDPLSIHKLVNSLINYSIHLPEGKDMTQIISAYPFVHGMWKVNSPMFKRNVLTKSSKMATLSFPGFITKNQLSKLCKVINGVFESKHIPCTYEINLNSERFSQSFNTKNSLSTIESQILQRVQCTIQENSHIVYSNSTKTIVV